MSTISKRGKSWRVIVRKKGVYRSATFDTKAEAQAWSVQTEAEILTENATGIPRKPVRDLLARYADEVSVKKRGERWEVIRLKLMAKMDIADVMLSDLDEKHIAKWRDERLKTVSSASVNREWSLLSNAFNVAVTEWKWLRRNPMKSLKKPPAARPRDRRISDDEIERLLFALGYDYEHPPVTVTARIGAAFLFAIETAMRAGEIVGLTWDRTDIEKRIVKLEKTKNGYARKVPLSEEAIRILEQLPKNEDSDSVFNITSPNLDAIFRKAKSRAVIENLHFHDTRHEAITRLAKKLDVLDLARMVGHRDLKTLMVYYNETAEELAKKL